MLPTSFVDFATGARPMSSLEIWCWIHFPRTPARAISRRAGPSSPVGRPGPREHAALCNDLGDSEVRKHEDETPAKTRHPDDCEVTQTGSFRGCNGARQLPLTPFGSPSSHKASGIVRLEGDQTPPGRLVGSSRYARIPPRASSARRAPFWCSGSPECSLTASAPPRGDEPTTRPRSPDTTIV